MGDNVIYNPQVLLQVTVPGDGWRVTELTKNIREVLGEYSDRLKAIEWHHADITFENGSLKLFPVLALTRSEASDDEVETQSHAIAQAVCQGLRERFPSSKYSVRYGLARVFWWYDRVYKGDDASTNVDVPA